MFDDPQNLFDREASLHATLDESPVAISFLLSFSLFFCFYPILHVSVHLFPAWQFDVFRKPDSMLFSHSIRPFCEILV